MLPPSRQGLLARARAWHTWYQRGCCTTSYICSTALAIEVIIIISASGQHMPTKGRQRATPRACACHRPDRACHRPDRALCIAAAQPSVCCAARGRARRWGATRVHQLGLAGRGMLMQEVYVARCHDERSPAAAAAAGERLFMRWQARAALVRKGGSLQQTTRTK